MALAPAQGIDWDAVTTARRALIGNPYQLDDGHLQAVEAWFYKGMDDVPHAMMDLCGRGLHGDARKVVLAAAHYAAREDARRGAMDPANERGRWLRGDLSQTLERAVEVCRPLGLRLEVKELRKLAWALHRFYCAAGRLLGSSAAMRRVRERLWTACFGPDIHVTLERHLAIRQQNILILGEPGTGKELVAAVIQAAVVTDDAEAPRSQGINCAAIPNELAEAELFGVEKGAHSTASARREGKIAAAHRGTLFLDEVAELPLLLQAKLLSVLANGKITPIGGNNTRDVDVRYISATSRPLTAMVQSGGFRDDLFSRLGQTVVELPPLRERREDIEAIGLALFRKLVPDREPEGESSKMVTQDLLFEDWLRTDLAQRPLPCNVRDLEAAIREYALGFRQLTRPRTGPAPSQPMQSRAKAELLAVLPQKILDCTATDEEVGAWYLKRVLKHTRGNQSAARTILGIDRGTVRRRLTKLGLGDDAVEDGEEKA